MPSSKTARSVTNNRRVHEHDRTQSPQPRVNCQPLPQPREHAHTHTRGIPHPALCVTLHAGRMYLGHAAWTAHTPHAPVHSGRQITPCPARHDDSNRNTKGYLACARLLVLPRPCPAPTCSLKNAEPCRCTKPTAQVQDAQTPLPMNPHRPLTGCTRRTRGMPLRCPKAHLRCSKRSSIRPYSTTRCP